jgi:hypothetical protein
VNKREKGGTLVFPLHELPISTPSHCSLKPPYSVITVFSLSHPCQISSCIISLSYKEVTTEGAKAMHYTLLGEDLWKYIAKGVSPLNLLEFSIYKLNFTQKSMEDVKELAQEFMINDAHANSYIHC